MNGKNIVIIGAGFGGITAAFKLASQLKKYPGYQIILVEKNSYQLYTPALYEIAAMPKSDADAATLRHAITISLKEIVAKKNILFLQNEFTGLDSLKKKVTFKDGTSLSYEFLIFALGAETNYFDIPGLKEYSLPLKTFNDGILLRSRIDELVASKNGILHIVIGGGGATGIELAGEFVNFVCNLQKTYKKEATCKITITLIEAAPSILMGFSPSVIKKAKEHLDKINIITHTNTTVTSVNATEIHSKDRAFPYDIFIWAGGTQGPQAIQSLGLLLNKKGQFVVNEYLEVAESIFAIGDNASFLDNNQKPIPGNIPIAEAEGRFVAKNIVRTIARRPKKKFFPKKKYPYILAIGKKYAVADLVIIEYSGFIGWFLKQLVELRYLIFILPLKKALSIWIDTIKVYSKND